MDLKNITKEELIVRVKPDFSEKLIPVNWNAIEDMVDKITYEKLTSQFWLATRMPVSKDVDDWSKMSETEQKLVARVFVGLTALDTLQSEDGVDALKPAVNTQHETAVLNNIGFMESEHARSYSSIFSTLNTNSEIREIFEWAETHETLQKKAILIRNVYRHGSDLQKKVASVFLESFLFYAGFYTPLYFLGKSKLINVAEVIKLIIRDESVHGSYIGHKFNQAFKELTPEMQFEFQVWVNEFLFELYENECRYTEYLYDEIGWTDSVKTFIRYNANKAMMNLHLPPVFPDTEEDVEPIVLNGISTVTANHDFFSTVGNGYLMSIIENTRDSDYDFVRDMFKAN